MTTETTLQNKTAINQNRIIVGIVLLLFGLFMFLFFARDTQPG